ncbi:MmgE/PrpD family protein [Acuticoccus mangrovi]|uniref:MmgE/PrpD family protein n=1 Tax=Acuticoccus mangrovi TaxID=2796142 RepID=A0A934II26_9HYPH|nr:MmgE/PrpD family protein [Acuticoccus mangrovi]MBJ3777109.1 MmgE/PrpD family protein [Acuticoccus mangrovi]
MADAIEGIVAHAIRIRFDDIPADVIATTQSYLLDTMGLIAAGASAPGCEAVIDQLVDWGGKPEARLFVRDRRVPAPAAAMGNSLMAHALDFDDTHERGDMHGYAVVLPAAMAMAERCGPVSGPEFLRAIVTGIDISYRLGMAIRVYRGWHPTATCGVFGAAIAAGMIARLSETELRNAMGIAYSLAAGNFQCILDGSLTKRMQPAFAARAAVEAAVYAGAGLTGAKDVLEGRFGLFPLYELGDYAPEYLRDDLGVRFEGMSASMKPYPSCRFCHAAVDAVIALKEAVGFGPDDVAEMELRMPHEAHDYVGGPYRPGDSPQVSAQFNAAYNAAVAVFRGKLGLAELEPEVVLDPAIRALADRVTTVETDEDYCFGPQDIIITLKDGRTLTQHVDVMLGHFDKPLTREQLVAKVRDCIAYGGAPASDVEQLLQWVGGLPTAADALAGLPTYRVRSEAA